MRRMAWGSEELDHHLSVPARHGPTGRSACSGGPMSIGVTTECCTAQGSRCDRPEQLGSPGRLMPTDVLGVG